MLPERLSKPIEDLRERAMAEPDSLEELTSTDAALDEILNAHAEAADLVPKLRECPDDVSDPPKPEMSPPWVFEERWQLTFRSAFTRRLAEIAPEAFVVRWDDTTYLSRLRIAGAPIVLSSRYSLIPGQPSTFRSTIRTSVPAQTPRLEIRPEGLFDGVGRVIGLVHDAKVGDDELDRTFVIDGSDAALALLMPDVRHALLAMDKASLDPKLVVRMGIVDLHFGKTSNNNPLEIMPDEAIAVVLGVRAAVERG